MRGTSRASLEAARARFEPVLAAAGTDAANLGEQLFAVVDALDHSGSLRRVLSDPSISGDRKAALVGTIASRADERVIEAVSGAVRSRWSAESDLADALEQLAFDALLASAEADGSLERIEDELFRLTRVLVGQREVRHALYDERVRPQRRVALVDSLIEGKVTPVTLTIARRAAETPRGRRFVATLGHVGDLAAARRRRLIASVTSGTVLNAEQLARLGEILQRAYGREVQLNVTVDPQVIGGLRIQVGPDVVDATVLSRLHDARRRLAS